MKKLLIILAIVSLICGNIFAGGGSQASGRNEVSEDRMFNAILHAAFTGFDPLRTNDAASSNVNNQIYETLYRLQPGSTEFQPLLAASLPEYSADGQSVTIRLRQGVRFHDGTPFDAAAVKHTIDLINDPNFPSGRRSIVAAIQNVEIVDNYTIRMNLSYPDGVLTAKLAHTNAAIVSPTAQRNQDLMVRPVGTGPYKFISSISGANVVLERNEDYWGPKPQIKNVTITVITDESTAISRMETGEADFFVQISVPAISRARSIRNITVGTSEASNMYFLNPRPNSSRNPLMANRDFRIAIAKAIDVKSFVDHVVTGYGFAAHSVMGPPILGYDPNANHGYPFDLEGARRIITENRWANEPISLLVPSTLVYIPMGEYVHANLRAAGFNNVQLELIEWAGWLTDTRAENRFDLTLGGWSNLTRDGSELFEPNWHSTLAAAQRFFINSRQLDDLIHASKNTTVPAERIRALRAADELMMREVFTIPLYYATNLFVYSNMFTNVTRDSGGTFYIHTFRYR